MASASKTKKSWREKLADDKDLPQVGPIEPRHSARWGTGTMVIPAPREVDAVMRKVPHGKVTTIHEIRTSIARKHKADVGCPLTTGIFAWIAAHAAEEAAGEGVSRITPYWRTLKSGGELNPKYPGGIAQHRRRLEVEEHHFIARGKRWFVLDYEQKLFRSR